MPFTRAGRDLALTERDAGTGKFDFAWDASGNPAFDNTEAHRLASLLIEHQGEWWADVTGRRGSLLHTVKNLRRNTPSQLAAYASDAIGKAVGDGKIRANPGVDARVTGTRARIEVAYQTVDGTPQRIGI